MDSTTVRPTEQGSGRVVPRGVVWYEPNLPGHIRAAGVGFCVAARA